MKEILEHLAIREGYKFTAAEGVLGFQGAYYSLTTGDGQKAYFIKCVPQGSKMVDEFYRKLGTFTKEIPVYLEAFPKMENFGCVWSRCYLGKSGRFLVLEDLTVAGWRVPEVMDADHINVALKGLAEFHAASLQLLDSSEEFVKWAQTKLAETMFTDDSRLPGRRMWDAYCRLAATVVSRYSPQFDDVDVFEILQKSVLSVKTSCKFKNCLNHGDPWMNNIFFKYDNDKPTSCRFVDFQSCRFAPPALDVSIFINIFAPDKYDELTLTYHKHLVNTSTTTILTTEELRDSSDFFKGPESPSRRSTSS